jgi:hypothetical protein
MRAGFFEVKDWEQASWAERLTSDLKAFRVGQPARGLRKFQI